MYNYVVLFEFCVLFLVLFKQSITTLLNNIGHFVHHHWQLLTYYTIISLLVTQIVVDEPAWENPKSRRKTVRKEKEISTKIFSPNEAIQQIKRNVKDQATVSDDANLVNSCANTKKSSSDTADLELTVLSPLWKKLKRNQLLLLPFHHRQ